MLIALLAMVGIVVSEFPSITITVLRRLPIAILGGSFNRDMVNSQHFLDRTGCSG